MRSSIMKIISEAARDKGEISGKGGGRRKIARRLKSP
jgi:hypothetical protein